MGCSAICNRQVPWYEHCSRTVNPNRQKVIGNMGKRGSHPFALVHKMECNECGEVYGANSCDIHLRKCPNCQGGKEGEQLT